MGEVAQLTGERDITRRCPEQQDGPKDYAWDSSGDSRVNVLLRDHQPMFMRQLHTLKDVAFAVQDCEDLFRDHRLAAHLRDGAVGSIFQQE
jgi:hypothetical protein